MAIGLSVARVIAVTWALSSAAASYANIETVVIVGDSNVIDTKERMRSYSGLPAVGSDFGSTSPEYLAAQIYFDQAPAPQQLYIGRWARTATAGRLVGASLTAAQAVLANFTAVASGGFKIAVNGGAITNVAGINLSGAANLSAVAALISTALTTATLAVGCTWDGARFLFTSTTTGATSAVSFLTAPTSGTDLGPLVNGTAAAGGYIVSGVAAETPLAAVLALDTIQTYWYGLAWACATPPADADYVAVAGYIEATTHIHGITTGEASAITSGNTTDVGSLLAALGYKRTFGQFSSLAPYAAAGIFGDLLTTNLTGSNTMPTVMWKPEAGVPAEPLTPAQADTLDGKRYNYFANYQNGASILVNGMCFGDAYIDEVFGLDWLQNRVQTDLFTFMASVPKVPQTDAGMTSILNCIEASLNVGVVNGLIAPGTWQAAGFGSLNTGDALPKGFYIYCPKISTQSATDRRKRVTPPIQIAIKLAGAVHDAVITMSVNR